MENNPIEVESWDSVSWDSISASAPKDAPHRETAVMILKRIITIKDRELAGLKHLFRIVEKAENGSPLEEEIWRLLVARRNHY
jgi:hypothetical protein